MAETIFHALVFNLHQPAGNLEHLLETEPWQTQQILEAIDRIPRSLWGWEDVGRVHLAMSGILLETLSDPRFQQRVYGLVDCGSLLWYLQNQAIIRILGSGYYHPVLPLIPAADREEQLLRWRGIARHLFWREDFPGFWPPEMGFCMEMIPLLRRMGYRYVLVDSLHVEAVTPMSWQELRYRPHIARWGDEQIVVVVRDRELSDAQLSGMDANWFAGEVRERTKWCDFPPLVTTATDGDNGGWFRNFSLAANFWGSYLPLLEQARAGSNIRPTFIDDYLERYGAQGEVKVHSGAWNTGWHDGRDYIQWTGSQLQRDALARVAEISRAVHGARWRAGEAHCNDTELHWWLEQAMWHLLRAETSCNFYWGEDWVSRAHGDLDASLAAIEQARRRLP